MGGRGVDSGINGKQLTMSHMLLVNEVAEIRNETNRIRASMAGIGSASGGASPHLKAKKCFCCEKYTLPSFSEYETCYICGWVDDPLQNLHPDNRFGKNPLSLNEARERLTQS